MPLAIACQRVEKLYLFRPKSASHADVIRKIKLQEGIKKEAAGLWRRVFDTVTRELRGFQMIAASDGRADLDIPSLSSAATMRGPSPRRRRACGVATRGGAEIATVEELGEMELIAQESHTAGLSEERRDERIKSGLLAEDREERLQRKTWLYRQVGPGRGDILRVWPR
jgi:hypothetical protein